MNANIAEEHKMEENKIEVAVTTEVTVKTEDRTSAELPDLTEVLITSGEQAATQHEPTLEGGTKVFHHVEEQAALSHGMMGLAITLDEKSSEKDQAAAEKPNVIKDGCALDVAASSQERTTPEEGSSAQEPGSNKVVLKSDKLPATKETATEEELVTVDAYNPGGISIPDGRDTAGGLAENINAVPATLYVAIDIGFGDGVVHPLSPELDELDAYLRTLPADAEIHTIHLPAELEAWWNSRSFAPFDDLLARFVDRIRAPGEIGRATTVYRYSYYMEGDLALEVGDEVFILEYRTPRWWFGTNIRTRESGVFPYNYVSLHPHSETPPDVQ